jgi:hypothetical protein
MCQVVVESLLYRSGNTQGTFARYKDPAADPMYRKEQLDSMSRKLFGNETTTGDALAHGYGVTNPAGKEHFGSEDQKGE